MVETFYNKALANDGLVKEGVVDSFDFGDDFDTELLLKLRWVCIIGVSKWRYLQESVGVNIEPNSIELNGFYVAHDYRERLGIDDE